MSRYYIVRQSAEMQVELLGNALSIKAAEVMLADIAKDIQVQNKGVKVYPIDERGYTKIVEPSGRESVLTFVSGEQLLGSGIKIISSMIREIGLDTEMDELVVKFTNGNSYRYEKVPEEVFFQIINAQSAGQMFNALVKGKFECRRTS